MNKLAEWPLGIVPILMTVWAIRYVVIYVHNEQAYSDELHVLRSIDEYRFALLILSSCVAVAIIALLITIQDFNFFPKFTFAVSEATAIIAMIVAVFGEYLIKRVLGSKIVTSLEFFMMRGNLVPVHGPFRSALVMIVSVILFGLLFRFLDGQVISTRARDFSIWMLLIGSFDRPFGLLLILTFLQLMFVHSGTMAFFAWFFLQKK